MNPKAEKCHGWSAGVFTNNTGGVHEVSCVVQDYFSFQTTTVILAKNTPTAIHYDTGTKPYRCRSPCTMYVYLHDGGSTDHKLSIVSAVTANIQLRVSCTFTCTCMYTNRSRLFAHLNAVVKHDWDQQSITQLSV